MREFDFLVIGAGSGLDVASVAADQGQSVALVEKGPLGGTCLNRGCIPSKQLLYHAEILETVERADEFSISTDVTDVDFEGIVREVTEDVQDSADSIYRGITASDQHTLVEGEARFVGEKTVEISGGEYDGERLRAEAVLVAAGTRPAIPDIDGIDDVDYLTSTEALELTDLPDHLVIVGGGYIGAELGHFFGTFGSDVTIIGRRPYLLPEADEEVAAAFTQRYADRFTVHTGYTATAASESDGAVTVEARPFEYPDDEKVFGDVKVFGDGEVVGDEEDVVSITGDELLLAAGRIPSTDVLNVQAAGIETDEDGFVETDDYLRTTADGVWALGDIVGEYLFKHSANHEARTVAQNVFGEGLEAIDYTAMPFAVFASPEVAGVGAREADLREHDTEYATNTYRYEDTARGSAMKVEGFVKVLIDLEGEILGCHIIGSDASTLIQEVVVAMKAGSGTVSDIHDAVHIHPALPEVVDRAFSGQFTLAGESPSHGHSHGHDHGHDHSHGNNDGHSHGDDGESGHEESH